MHASELVAREPQRLCKRSEYERMAEIGILDGEKVELQTYCPGDTIAALGIEVSVDAYRLTL